MSSSAQTQLRIAKGSVALGNTYGTPIATPSFKPLRFTKDGLKANFKTVKSKEVVNSFRTKQYRRVGIDAGGSSGVEFLFGNVDDLLEALLYSLWQRTPQRYNATADTQISDVAAATGIVTVQVAVANDENRWGAYAVAQLIQTRGFTNAGNNFLKRATAASGTSFTVDITGLVNEAAPPLGARAKVVGVEAPANGNISLTTAGLGAGEVAIINGTGIDFLACGIVPGMWLKAANFPTVANNGFFRALNVTATRIGADIAPTGVATDTAAAAQVRLYMPDYLRDGSAAITWFDIERYLPQLATPEYHYFLSMLPNAFNLNLGPQDIINCDLGFVGSRRTTGTSRVASPTDLTADALDVLPRTGDMYDSSSNIARILMGNTPLVDLVEQCAWQIQNNASGLPVVGNLGAGRILRPSFGPTLSLTQYYESRAGFLASLEADTALSVSMVMTDPLGTKAFVIDYPQAKVLADDLNDIVVDSELDAPINIGAVEHVAFGCMVQLMRWEQYT